MSEALRKKLFWLIAFANFIMVFIFVYMTPYLSDDILYMDEVVRANNFFDLIVQEYDHYMGHSGRTVAHFLLRVFLFTGNKIVFDVAASIVFVVISLLIYMNVDHRKKFDVRVYSFIVVLLWLFDPTISDSVFWEDGACNYLFTGCIVLGFVTVFRKTIKENLQRGIGFTVGMFFFGLAAGWCNENTSGGAILFALVMMAAKWRETKSFKSIKPWMISGLVGAMLGFGLMITAPGNFIRAVTREEAHTGYVALMARFLKITLNIKEGYLPLVFAFIVIVIAIAYRLGDRKEFFRTASGIMLFGFLFLATCYALLGVSSTQLRAYYGAGLFLMTAVASGYAWLANVGYKEAVAQTIATSLVTILGVLLIFTYIEDGANVARVKREFDERDAYLAQMAEEGVKDVVVPMLRPDWECRYTTAYTMDITEDPGHWINVAYAGHYGLDSVSGVERENWTEY
ncbi:DUF3329 domain-containing protein [Butyrivibrio sp. XPD2006]|uniref:DUF3329 domain-containing protein n=1 Tax=Butyrivibrio sp. XPD2006 TaxID=1280668 RepID=UPI0003B76E2D|nr:DUF6056 family protein [Butyrivibrio sp. XPD2006]